MRRFGLLGKNISYSFSPGYFREKFLRMGLSDCRYDIFDLKEIGEFPALLRRHPDLEGLNVTIPYKEAVLSFLQELDPTAADIGAVNTIRVSPGGLKGFNTDVIGFRESLRPLLKESDTAALILGTGGASKAVAYALGQLGIPFRMVSRDPAHGQLSYEALDVETLKEFPILVNCPPLGTFPAVSSAPDIPYVALTPAHLLYDLIYNPDQTTFLKRGAQQGARTKNGLEMLRLQAEASWELWNR
jgi:shikimate dehydrogenase